MHDTIQHFRAIMGRFATGVTIVTTQHRDEYFGLTVNSFTSVSLDPLYIVVNISRSAHSHDRILHSGLFAVNILASDQRDLSVLFSSPQIHDRFSRCSFERSPLGNPIFSGALAWLDARVEQVIDAGDHSMFLGRVEHQSLLHPEKSPLLYYAGNYATLHGTAVGEPLSQVPRG